MEDLDSASPRAGVLGRRAAALGVLLAVAVLGTCMGLERGWAPPVVDEPEGPAGRRARRAITYNPNLVPRDLTTTTDPSASASHCVDLDGVAPPRIPGIRRHIATWMEGVRARIQGAAVDPLLAPELRSALSLTLASEPTEWERGLGEVRKVPTAWHSGHNVLADVASWLAAGILDADPPRARELAREAIQHAPDQLLPRLVEIAASRALRDGEATARAASGAFALAPSDPVVAWALYWHTRDDIDIGPAIAGLDGYLSTAPWDLWVARRRARLEAQRVALGEVRIRTHAGVSSATRRELDGADVVAALATTGRALDDAAILLDAPRRPELSLFIYGTHRELIDVTCSAEWTGGMYDGAVHVTAEYLPYPEWAELVLRHEALHAAMDHAISVAGPTASSPPAWFREGVAQYFADGVTPASEETFALLLREHTYVPLGSMDRTFGEIVDGADAGMAYHQALAMVLYLVERRGERGIAEAMSHLERGGDPATLLSAIGAPLSGETLLAFLAQRQARLSGWVDRMAAVTRAP